MYFLVTLPLIPINLPIRKVKIQEYVGLNSHPISKQNRLGLGDEKVSSDIGSEFVFNNLILG